MKPKLSIITINFNNVIGLQRTMVSVFAQNFIDFEYIIIDGGSNDGSKEIIEQHAEKLKYWVSEKDNGIYNAMNKGIVRARGEYLLFLNSGDYLMNESLCSQILSGKNTLADIIYGNMLKVYLNSTSEIWKLPSDCTVEFLVENTLPHSCSFIRKRLFDKYGLYDERLYIVADWAFFFKVLVTGVASVQYVDVEVSAFEMEGISNKNENKAIIQEQRQSYLNEMFPLSVQRLIEQKNKLDEENLKLRNLLTSRKFLLKKFIQEVLSGFSFKK